MIAGERGLERLKSLVSELFLSEGERKGGRRDADPPFGSLNSTRGVKVSGLFAVAVVIDIARALQRDFIRRLRTALLLSRLRLGRGLFGGFGCLRGLCATDRAYHIVRRSTPGGENFSR